MRFDIVSVIFIFAFLGCYSLASKCQTTVKTLNPELGFIPVFDEKAQAQIKRRDELLVKENITQAEKTELNKLLEKFDETVESIWDVVGGGCSWYCAGGHYKIVSSSNLANQGNTTYEAANAHDLSFKTAWVEGSKGYGIGEFIEYYFKNDSPRITEIKIFNGYVKSQKSWEENSRVKKLELSVNGEKYAILNLSDTRAQQNFKISTLGRRPDKKDLVLKFKILEVYKGTKYEDTAITEIYFDGIDVH